jgi:hypothetical protein
MQKPSLYDSRLKELRQAGIRIKKHKLPTKGQKAYVAKWWNFIIPQRKFVIKLTKPQEQYFRAIGADVYKGKLITANEGAKEARIKRYDKGMYAVERKKDAYFRTSEYPAKIDERIDETIIRALKHLKKNEHILVGVEGKNIFNKPFTKVEDFYKYINTFGDRYRLSGNDEDMVITNIRLVSVGGK